MKFDTTGLRRFEGSFGSGLREQRLCPLILIKADGTVNFAAKAPEKDELLKKHDAATDVILCAIPGQHWTDVFVMSAEDLATRY